MTTAADLILVLCTLAPCYHAGGELHIPVPEVSQRTWAELYPRRNYQGFRVRFVPMPRGA